MKKKFLLSFLIVALLLAFCGCSSNETYKFPLSGDESLNENFKVVPTQETIAFEYFGEENLLEDETINFSKTVAENKMPAVLNIHSTGKFSGENYSASGTGFIITKDGYIITNAHVIMCEYKIYEYRETLWGEKIKVEVGKETKQFTNVYAAFNMNSRLLFPLGVVNIDIDKDLAVLKFKNNFTYTDKDNNVQQGLQRTCEFTDSEKVVYGQPVVAIGNGNGYGLSVTTGVVSNPKNIYANAIQTDTAINPGNSGGPLFNNKSQVIGVTSSKIVTETVDNIGFAIPSNIVFTFLEMTKETKGININYSVN